MAMQDYEVVLHRDAHLLQRMTLTVTAETAEEASDIAVEVALDQPSCWSTVRVLSTEGIDPTVRMVTGE